MKMLIRHFGIAPCIDMDGKAMYVLIEVDAAGEVRGPCAYNADREVLVKAVEHVHGVIDEHLEWVDKASASPAAATVLSLVPSSRVPS